MLIRQIVFLVGGRGTRLGGLTAQTPKPLLDVSGRPFLDTLIENAARHGLRNIILLAGYLGESVAQRYHDWGRARGLEIECIIESQAAGTGGALRYAADRLDDTFFVSNGDSLFDFNLLELPRIAAPHGWVGKMALRRVPDGSRYGQVITDGLRVKDMLERAPAGPALINGGVYVLRRDVLSRIKALPCSIERDVFPVLAHESRLFAKEFDGFFLDIGVPEDLARAQEAVPAHMRRPAVFFDRDGVLNHDKGYTHRVEDFRWCLGAVEAIRTFNAQGYYVFVVTNQGGIAHGFYDEKAVQDLHAWMNNDLAPHGAHIDAFYYCPHHPQGKRAGYAVECDCRKPGTGMIRAALREWPVDKSGSILIGDKQSDVDAATAAEIRAVLWNGGDLAAWAQDIVAPATAGAA